MGEWCNIRIENSRYLLVIELSGFLSSDRFLTIFLTTLLLLQQSARIAEIQNAIPAAERKRKTASSSTNSANGRSRLKRRNTSVAGGRHGTSIQRKPEY